MSFTSISDIGVGEIFGRISRDLSRLFSAELELAKRELRSDFRSAMRSAVAAGAAVMGAYLFLLFASVAGMFGLAALMPIGWAALIVAGVWAIVTAVLVSRAKAMASGISGAPRARETLKEDRRWITTVKR
jgi:uncharacterized membrane protein